MLEVKKILVIYYFCINLTKKLCGFLCEFCFKAHSSKIFAWASYPDSFWANWYIHLTQWCHDGWHQFWKYVPSVALKVDSLVPFVLRILCKTFSKLLKFYIVKHPSLWMSIHMFTSKIATNLWELQSNLSWGNAAKSTIGIT